MLFNSYIFVFLFFPLCFVGYYGLLRMKKYGQAKLFLIAMSFWFYGYFNVSYLLIMVGSIAFNYAFHRLLSKRQDRALMLLAVASNLAVLFYFKYFDFFLSTVNSVFSLAIPLKKILLPLGISFFTFQQISFVVDTYRGEVKDCSLLDYALFVSFFPQLIAGPIVNHGEMLPQFANLSKLREEGGDAFWHRLADGFALFTFGLTKKVLIADTLGRGVDYGYANLAILGRFEAILVIFSYAFQLYFDFSGYCDMARGIGKMLGIAIPKNFDSPYKATNIIDFWKRWHITLNRFLTKYVYIPLGGNRKGQARMYLNLLIVFFLSGLWHGAGWNFIVWGMLHGILYVITRAWQNSKWSLHLPAFISRIATFVYVSIAWVYFRAQDVSQANELLRVALLGKMQKVSMDFANCFKLDEFWYVIKVLRQDNKSYSPYILMVLSLMVCIYFAMIGENAANRVEKMRYKTVSALFIGVIFVWCVLSFSKVSIFLYFNF